MVVTKLWALNENRDLLLFFPKHNFKTHYYFYYFKPYVCNIIFNVHLCHNLSQVICPVITHLSNIRHLTQGATLILMIAWRLHSISVLSLSRIIFSSVTILFRVILFFTILLLLLFILCVQTIKIYLFI